MNRYLQKLLTIISLGILLVSFPKFAFSQEGGGGEIPVQIPTSSIPNPIRIEIPENSPNSVNALMTALEAYEAWIYRFDGRFAALEQQVAGLSQGLDSLEFEVLGDVGIRADAIVTHQAITGAFFLLEEIRYQLDGLPIASRLDSKGSMGTRAPFDVFSGRIVPGKHIMSVEMTFRVRGYNLLASSEFRGARFRVRDTYEFEAKPGFTTKIQVVGRDAGTENPANLSLRQIEKRFRITFEKSDIAGAIPPATPVKDLESVPENLPSFAPTPSPDSIPSNLGIPEETKEEDKIPSNLGIPPTSFY